VLQVLRFANGRWIKAEQFMQAAEMIEKLVESEGDFINASPGDADTRTSHQPGSATLICRAEGARQESIV
jgi:hypothetical protein